MTPADAAPIGRRRASAPTQSPRRSSVAPNGGRSPRSTDRGEWRALAARALEPNVFYEPAFALAAAPVFGARCGAVLVWSQGGTRLIGLFPARDRAALRRAAVLAGWTHPYAPLGAPLVDRDEAEP